MSRSLRQHPVKPALALRERHAQLQLRVTCGAGGQRTHGNYSEQTTHQMGTEQKDRGLLSIIKKAGYRRRTVVAKHN